MCDLAVAIPSDVTETYSALAAELGVVIVTSLFERRAPGLYHNTAVVFESDGSMAGMYRKMHIPDDPAYYEKFYFTPGDLGFGGARVLGPVVSGGSTPYGIARSGDSDISHRNRLGEY